MSVLTKDEILKRIDTGDIKIEPFDVSLVGPASYDLHLANKFRVFKEVKKIFEVTAEANFEKVTEMIEVNDRLLLMPGQTVHGLTQEKISLPPDICGWLEGRSRYSRLGLIVHITSGFIQPGSVGNQVLEINNLGPIPLSLAPGIAICQIIFQECRGKASYKGRFTNQREP